MVVDDLLKSGYTTNQIVMFQEYNECGIKGEIDVYAMRDNYISIFEIKNSTKHRKKAIEQMNRAKHYFFQDHLHLDERVFKFFVHYDNHTEHGYDYEWIKE